MATSHAAPVPSPTPEGWGARVETFERNLAALARIQPDLARRLGELPIPTTVEPASGRDGSPTFRIAGADGRRSWLGGSSMPSISAPAILERFEGLHLNVLAPAAGTGWELDLLCRRTLPHVAVFAYEAEPLLLKLVLHAVDLSAPLAAGRLVPLAFAPLEEALPEFMARHPGYDLPSKMLAHPIVPPAEIERLRQVSETIASVVLARQGQCAHDLAVALSRRGDYVAGSLPRVALCSSDARPRGLETAGHLAGALKQLGWPVASSVPDSPWSCHTLTRLSMIHEHRPDLVLLLNGCAGRFAEALPPPLPVASWFWPEVEISKELLDGAASHHLLLATTTRQIERLRELGAAPARTHWVEVGVDTSAYRPVRVLPERREQLSCDAAILADAEPIAPAALGITLESHVRLWDRLRALVAERPSAYQPAMAAQLVREAEQATGVALESEELRSRLVKLVQGPLARRVVTAAAVSYLRGFGLEVRIWGQGWDDVPEMGGICAGPIPSPEARNELYQTASAVVFPILDPQTALTMLEVIAAGGIPITAAGEPGWLESQPRVGAVLGKSPQYDRFKTLVSLLRQAAAPDKTLRGCVETLRETVVGEHALAARWKAILKLLRAP